MLPIAETFFSIQGEGTFTGTPMYFIRLAGCNVGRYNKLGQDIIPNPDTPFQLLHPEYATCISYAGEEFICDTDYRVKYKKSVADISNEAINSGTRHVSITGGEPFIHEELADLVMNLIAHGIHVHIETSGTRDLEDLRQRVIDADESDFDSELLWITCAPKLNFIPENALWIDEYKFLVRGDRDEKFLKLFLATHRIENSKVWVTPIDEFINPVLRSSQNPADIEANRLTFTQRDFAIDCVKRNPEWRLSCQVHKYLGVR